MLPRAVVTALCLVTLAFGGCDWTTEPVALELRFVGNHVLNADGSCEVRFLAQAFGLGTAEWERVVIRRGDTVVEDFVGDATANYWGGRRIQAGEEQTSAPFVAPDSARAVSIDLNFRMGGGDLRQLALRPECVPSGTT